MRCSIALCALALWALIATAATAAPVPPPVDLPFCDTALQTPVPAPGGETALLAVETEPVQMAAPSSGFTFEGCFTFFPAGPCRDVFRDSAGTLWICKDCGTTRKPPGGCSVLTGSGFWCS